ncbi:MAG: hypothetical protein HY861_02965 [Chlamydiia bacterium]|nr:hypothetical protein [Chlamydiia bacterium]
MSAINNNSTFFPIQCHSLNAGATLQIEKTMTLGAVKQLIETATKVPPREQRLVINGKDIQAIDDNTTVAQYPALEKDCVVFVVYRLPLP